MPFAASIKLISKHTPIVFVEANNVLMHFKNSIISNQTIENFFEKLLDDVKWFYIKNLFIIKDDTLY